MENNSNFNLQERIDLWIYDLNSKPYITEADSEELRTHLFDIIEHLKEAGLDDEEAFLVATKRLGNIDDLIDDYEQTNFDILQVKKSLIIFLGVLLYFLNFYFIKSSYKVLIFTLLTTNHTEGLLALNWGKRYLICWYFIVIIFFVSIILMERKTLSFIEKIKFKPKHTILLIFLTFIFALIDYCINPLIKNTLLDNYYLQDLFIHTILYYDVTFPFLISIGFVFIYYKYQNKTKIS